MNYRWPVRALVLVMVIGAGVGLGHQIVSVGMSRHAQDANPEVALRWRAGNGAALSARAEDALERGEGEAAIAQAKLALVHGPIEARAFRVLAQAKASQGAADQGLLLIRHAGALTRRDPSTSYWLYREAMLAGRYQEAVRHADALMRRAPRVTPLTVWELARSIDDQRLVSALVQQLGQAPPWRAAFVRELYRSAPSDQAALELLSQLPETSAPAAPEEIAPLLERIVRRGDYERAYGAWRSFLAPSERPTSRAAVFDGAFTQPPGPAPFGWRLSRTPDAEARLDPEANGAGLQVRAGGFSDAKVAAQLLLLPAGRYRLTSKARLIEGRSGELQWRITCEGARGGDLLRLRVRLGAGDFAKAAEEFVTPADCRAQRLTLWTIGDDRRTPMTAWIDEVGAEAIRRGP